MKETSKYIDMAAKLLIEIYKDGVKLNFEISISVIDSCAEISVISLSLSRLNLILS